MADGLLPEAFHCCSAFVMQAGTPHFGLLPRNKKSSFQRLRRKLFL
jgi:hypothetical protein